MQMTTGWVSRVGPAARFVVVAPVAVLVAAAVAPPAAASDLDAPATPRSPLPRVAAASRAVAARRPEYSASGVAGDAGRLREPEGATAG